MKYKGTYYHANNLKTKFMAEVNGEIIASAKTEAALKGKITNYLKKQEEALKAAEAEEKEAPESDGDKAGSSSQYNAPLTGGQHEQVSMSLS